MDKSVAVLILHNDTPPPKPAGRSLVASNRVRSCLGPLVVHGPRGCDPPDPTRPASQQQLHPLRGDGRTDALCGSPYMQWHHMVLPRRLGWNSCPLLP